MPLKPTRIVVVVGIAFLALISGLLFWPKGPAAAGKTKVRITFTAYPDTSLFYYGKEKGIFDRLGIDLDVKQVSWNDQIEFTGGGGTDIAMSTLGEIVAKAKSMQSVGKQVDFFLPAWGFEGTIFVSRPELKSFAEIRLTASSDQEAATDFLKQLRGKILAVPAGGTYEQAIRAFITRYGGKVEDFTFVNTKAETGINGLEDKNVAIAAAGAFERPEALRRGYKIALSPSDLGAIVVTGFICSDRFYKDHSSIIDSFAKGWYETLNSALTNQEDLFQVVMPKWRETGAKEISLQDYKAHFSADRFAMSAQEARSMFFDTNSPFYWRKAWNSSVQTLREGDRGDQVPANTDSFVAGDVNTRLLK